MPVHVPLVALSILIGWSSTGAAELRPATSESPHAPPGASAVTCALLADSGLGLADSPLVALLEVRLAAHPGLRLVERREVEKVLAEQKLQAAFAPEATAQRANLGGLLRADLLILLRAREGPQRVIEVVICETRAGLRLQVALLPWGAPEEVTEDVERLLEAALVKRREGTRTILAVPPFVTGDFTHENDHLQSGYARLLEQSFMTRAGVLVVELAEAQAITTELGLSGGEQRVNRTLPLYVLGEYEHSRDEGGVKVAIGISLRRGQTELHALDMTVDAGEAGTALREAAARLLQVANVRELAAPDVRTEVQGLNARTRAFSRIGMWSEALELMEASLLLDPDQPDVRRGALHAIAMLFPPPARGPSSPPARDAVARAMVLYRAGMRHEAELLREQWPSPGAERTGIWTLAWPRWFEGLGSAPEEVRALCTPVRAADREAVIRRLEARFARGDGLNEGMVFSFVFRLFAGMPGAYEDRLRIIRVLPPDAPSAVRTIKHCASWGVATGPFDSIEYNAFLERIEALPGTAIRQAVRELREQGPLPRQPTIPPRGPDRYEDAKVRITRIYLKHKLNPELVWALSWWIPCGPGMDAYTSGQTLFVMSTPGVLEPVYELETHERYRNICWDGRYLWAPVQSQHRSLLLAVEPWSRKVIEITGRDGLLPATDEVAAAAIAPGRVCIAASFGPARPKSANGSAVASSIGPPGLGIVDRSWLALVGIGEDSKPAVRVFHESRQQPEVRQENSGITSPAGSVFTPDLMIAFTDPADVGPVRILLKRRGGWDDVLLIDPDAGTISSHVIGFRRFDSRFSTSSGSALIWQEFTHPRDAVLLSAGWPDFCRSAPRPVPLLGRLAIVGNRLLLVADQEIWSAPLAGGEFVKEATTEPGMLRFERFCESSHYGLVGLRSVGAYQVQLLESERPEP